MNHDMVTPTCNEVGGVGARANQEGEGWRRWVGGKNIVKCSGATVGDVRGPKLAPGGCVEDVAVLFGNPFNKVAAMRAAVVGEQTRGEQLTVEVTEKKSGTLMGALFPQDSELLKEGFERGC